MISKKDTEGSLKGRSLRHFTSINVKPDLDTGSPAFQTHQSTHNESISDYMYVSVMESETRYLFGRQSKSGDGNKKIM
jgi:hypothetical protein